MFAVGTSVPDAARPCFLSFGEARTTEKMLVPSSPFRRGPRIHHPWFVHQLDPKLPVVRPSDGPSPECLQDCGGNEGSHAELCRSRPSSQAATSSSESTNWHASSPG